MIATAYRSCLAQACDAALVVGCRMLIITLGFGSAAGGVGARLVEHRGQVLQAPSRVMRGGLVAVVAGRRDPQIRTWSPGHDGCTAKPRTTPVGPGRISLWLPTGQSSGATLTACRLVRVSGPDGTRCPAGPIQCPDCDDLGSRIFTGPPGDVIRSGFPASVSGSAPVRLGDREFVGGLGVPRGVGEVVGQVGVTQSWSKYP
jgi:hypothetical protein